MPDIQPSGDEKPQPRTLVMVCTYNERENISALIPIILSYVPDADVVVLDDNSPDGTGEVVEELANESDRVFVEHRTQKEGLGAATIAGLQYGMEHGYDLIINMDADFSHPPEKIPELIATATMADIAVASRYVPGGQISGWRWYRHLMSRGMNLYCRFWLRLKARDVSGSFRCYRVDKLQQVDFDRFISKGYAFNEELLFRCRRADCTMQEVPFHFKDRVIGQSKINVFEVVRALWDVFKMPFTK